MNGHSDIPDPKEFHLNFSTRVKKVAIQLHEYRYYHGPSSEKFQDKRIIGRKKNESRLLSLITESEVPSGVYLISGYRGSGKSSLVNRVIEILTARTPVIHGSVIASLIILVIYFASVFFLGRWKNEGFDYLWLLWALFGFALLIFSGSLAVIFLGRGRTKDLARLRFSDLVRLFVLRNSIYAERIKRYFDVIYLICFSFPILVSAGIILLLEINPSYDLDPFFLMNLLMDLFALVMLVNIFYNINEYTKNGQGNFSVKNLMTWIWDKFKLNRFVFIKLNLGYSNLREIDILRLLARNLQTSLKNYYSKQFILSQRAMNLIFLLIVYVMVYFFYYQEDVYQAHQDIITTMGYTNVFPSQSSNFQQSPYDSVHKIYENYSQTLHSKYRGSSILMNQHSEFHGDSSLPSAQNVNKTHFEHKTVVEYVWEKSANLIKMTVTMADLYIYMAYTKIRWFVVNGFFWGYLSPDKEIYKGKSIVFRFTLIPFHIDYLFLIYLILTFAFGKYLIFGFLFHSIRPKRIIRNLRHLNEIIVAEETTERFAAEKIPFNLFSFLSPKVRKRTIADVREIEKYLIDIFNDIDTIGFPYSKPKVIVVLDELDKIESRSVLYRKGNQDQDEPDNTSSPFVRYTNPSFTIDGTRERQQTLQVLLSNLKFFLGDAKAKFIFIAGREMFDASLADVSDRNYFMGSIFNDVIYVNSFLSEDKVDNPSDITSMIEKYVCQFLMPQKYLEEHLKINSDERMDPDQALLRIYSLEMFNLYLKENFPHLNEEEQDLKVFEKIIRRQKREKVIGIIKQFIIYLTHASNGAPKKVTNYFENYIEYTRFPDEHNLLIVSNLHDIVIQKNKSHYLVFDFSQQCELGLINYITLPIVLTISNHIKNFDDKLLVSATYLFDHLVKFHHNGFSWRNLEYVPEILEINKTPELRSFIAEIIRYLSQTHLQVIISGLYDFRFNHRLSKEITFLSKISEEASAAFNFTLDESLSIKHYYHSLLKRLEERYQHITTDRKQYINSIAMVHSILGDLYFYDEEYNDAALEYLDSIQFLRYNKIREENYSLFLILVRNMLKLGLTFEKRRTYDSAFQIFQELCSMLVSYRTIDLPQLGLEEKRDPESKDKHKTVLTTLRKDKLKHKWDLEFKQQTKQTVPLSDRTMIHTFEQNFPDEAYFEKTDRQISHATDFIHKISEELNPVKESVIGKIYSFEGLRLMYQPLLAKIQIIEKCMIGGLTKGDLRRVEKEFKYLQRTIQREEKYLIPVEFYSKLGDILFYKTGNISFYTPSKKQHAEKGCPTLALWIKKLSSDDSFNIFDHVAIKNDPGNKRKKHPLQPVDVKCGPCLCYLKSLIIFIKQEIDPQFEVKKTEVSDLLREVFDAIIKKYQAITELSHIKIKILAGLISDFADSRLGCKTFPEEKAERRLSDLINELPPEGMDKREALDRISKNLEYGTLPGIAFQYYLSGKFYKKANEFKTFVWQQTKILHLFKIERRIFSDKAINLSREDLDKVDEMIVTKAIRECWAAYENAHMLEISENKKIMNVSKGKDIEHPDLSKPITLRRIEIFADLEEIILLFIDIRTTNLPLSLNPIKKRGKTAYMLKGEAADLFYKNYISPYIDPNTCWNRLQRLQMKVKINHQIYQCIENKFFNKSHINTFCKKNGLFERQRRMFQLISGTTAFALTGVPTIYIVDEGSSNESKVNHLEIGLFDLIAHLVADSLFCLNELIVISNAFGKSFSVNHSYFGSLHQKMMKWTIIYDAIKFCEFDQFFDNYKHSAEVVLMTKKLISGKSKTSSKKATGGDQPVSLRECLDGLLEDWLPVDSFKSLSMVYHCELAIRRYYSAIETHTEGKSHKNFIEDMSYLNDDFNDKIAHFFVAAERLSVNNDIYPRIKELKQLYKRTTLYQYHHFLDTRYSRQPTVHYESRDQIKG